MSEIRHLIEIKSLSVNQCWQGRRYKTDDYKSYEEEMLIRLPKHEMIEGNIGIDIEFGFSSHYSVRDIDNNIKPLLDILEKKGYFKNDNQISEMTVKKVKSDKDYIVFKIYEREN